MEISPETIESNNSHTRSSGDIESQETYNSHTGSRGCARDHHALNQFFAENSIATDIDGENLYDTENSINDINQDISNMSNLRSYHGEEAIRLFQTPYPLQQGLKRPWPLALMTTHPRTLDMDRARALTS